MSREVTANFLYIRFHGSKRLYSSRYTPQELDEWVSFIKANRAEKVFAYFNNDKSAYAVDNAEYLRDQLSKFSNGH